MRKVVFEDHVEPLCPPEPAPPKIAPEPIPAYTTRFHDMVRHCHKGHMYSSIGYNTKVRALQDGLLSLKEVMADVCPHCERNDWAEDRDAAQADYEKKVQAFQQEKRAWDRRQHILCEGIETPSRAVKL